MDNMIKSDTASILGESPVHSFTSLINSAIRSSSATEEDLGASPLHTFAPAVDNARSRSSAAPFSQLEVVPNATRHAPARLFTWAELEAATNNFSLHNKIRDDEYRGKLADGREVAINKWITTSWGAPFSKFKFTIVSCLNHRNLVRLAGYCKNRGKRLLVYEYMKNGSLRDCLQDKNNVDKDSSVLNSWKMRIKIAWDASRGIRCMHYYANPSFIHRVINSSNILLDATWTARVSAFGLSFKCPEPDGEYDVVARTVGYMRPEYMSGGVLTAKCDVYGVGVVLLELLTGKTAMFNSQEDGGLCKQSVVELAVRAILAGDLFKILDSRVGPPDAKEAEALRSWPIPLYVV